ncbi:phage tail tape measure protein [Arcanobacterium urinimassiliense]|uniref:phage tail tape measure protein n=1 Tax=Arcanobacterium urinimassiliense TaxID=1871014 RepID=UPI00093CCBEF|nr:phage tail tape measure protein [Arcanobacterium urinimassiliense]
MSSNKTISVTMRANVADFKAQVRSAETSLDDLVKKADKTKQVASTGLGRMAQSMEYQRAQWTAAGAALTGFGLAAVGSLGAAAKAAVDWQSAFAGVKKTVDGTDEDYAKLNGELREMARTLPASHKEIAGVAEAAGQLGIQKENIASFTRTMIDMGESTNLSAEEAATTLARFANIMGTSQDKFPNLGSSIVALGNNFATTEREIADMSMRLASAGKQAGLTEGDVFGIATALSSVGIEAEAGGTAFSRVMIEMRNSVDTGNSKLEVFAKTAGMTTKEFQAAFKKNAGGAITSFVQGLGKISKSGQSIQPILQDLGMTDVRVGNALRSSASAADLFSKAMSMGNQAFKEGAALGNEAEQRYKTVASRVEVLKNNLTDMGISIGSIILPIVGPIVSFLADMAGFMAKLPGPIQGVVGALTSLGGVMTLATGGFLLLAPRVMETVSAFRALKAADIPFISRAISMLGKSAKGALISSGIGLAIVALGTAFSYLSGKTAETKQAQEELGSTLDQTTGAITDQSLQALAADEDLQKMAKSYEKAGGHASDFWKAIAGDKNAIETVHQLRDQVNQTNAELNKYNTSTMQAQRYSTGWADAVDEKNKAMSEERQKILDSNTALGYMRDSYGEATTAAGEMADASTANADGLDQVGDSAAGAAEDLGKYLEQLAEAAGINLSADEAAIKYKDSLEKINEALNAGVGASAEGTKAQRENQQSLIDLAKDSQKVVQTYYAQNGATDELAAKTHSVAQDFINTATQMGLTGDEAVALAANYGLIPDTVRTKADFDKWKASNDITGLKKQMESVDGKVTKSKHVHDIFQNIHETITRIFGGSSGGHATGGLIKGPGTSTSDSIPARLSDGEYVIRAAAVQKYGTELFHQLNSMAVPKFAAGGYVSARKNLPPTVQVAAPSFEGAVVQGQLRLSEEGFFELVDGRIAAHPGVRAADGLAGNIGRYSRMMGV